MNKDGVWQLAERNDLWERLQGNDADDIPPEIRKRIAFSWDSIGYRPSMDFPVDRFLLVQTEALREFETQFHVPKPKTKTAQTADRTHVSDKLAKLNQAAHKFWSNADRCDRLTHPDNARVKEWLMEQGFSETLAKKAATILRPEWAPTGRKPEE